MRFAQPDILWLLGMAVGALALFLHWSWRKKQRLMTRFVQQRLLSQLTVGVSPLREKTRRVLLTLAVAGALLALARPQWGFAWEEARQRGLDIIVAVDTSRSMLARDVAPDRLTRAKLAALDLLRLARTDRLALLPFAGTAFLQCPLTIDNEAFRQNVEALDVTIMPQGGTALAQAIEVALEAFRQAEDNFKILLLITDGEDHDSGALEAARRAAQAQMRIFTLGVGTPEGELLQQRDESGGFSYIKDSQGSAVKSRLNEELLQQIATETGGFYLALRSPGAMEILYEQGLAPLPQSESASRLFQRFHERFYWPLGLAVLLLILELFLPERRRVTREGPAPAPRHAPAPPAAALVVVLLLLLPMAIEASPAVAQRRFERGEYGKAQLEYEQLIEHDPDDRRWHYNAGAAAYRGGDFERAVRAFQEATTAPDLDLQQRAYYNLGNALYRTGEAESNPQARVGSWQKAVQKYEAALKLDPDDADARFNLEFVRRKLEELEQQNEPPPESNPDSPESSEDEQEQDQSTEPKPRPSAGEDESKPESQPGSKQEESPQPDTGDSSQEPSADSSKPEESGSDSQETPEGRQESPPEASPKSEERQPQTSDQSPAAEGTPESEVPDGQMTTQQARRLLDAQREEERAMIFLPPPTNVARMRIFKDW